MKRKIFTLILLSFVLSFSLTACQDNSDKSILNQESATSSFQFSEWSNNTQTKLYTVLYYVDETIYYSAVVKEGECAPIPPLTPKKTNMAFVCWSDFKFLNYEHDFSSEITKDTKLYARFDIDAVTVTNEISTNKIKGIFTVYTTSSKTTYSSWDVLKLNPKTTSISGQGSSWIFHCQDGNYYLLTNCHVAVKEQGYTSVSYKVTDYQGKTYTAYLYSNSSKMGNAISADYDLACLYFKSDTEYPVFTISNTNPDTFSHVISLGTPKGQTNAITFGEINCYKTISVQAEAYQTNVKFSVINHTSYIDSGSSGGPLLDINYRVVGVNYASNQNSTPNNPISFAVPALKIREFLNNYVYV